MVIHNFQTEFRFLVAIVHTRDSKNNVICAQAPRLYIDIFMRMRSQRSEPFVFHYVDTPYWRKYPKIIFCIIFKANLVHVPTKDMQI